jgi:formate dehydrogenase major subunit
MLHVTINQHAQAVAEGQTILQALRGCGVEVPTLCHDDRLKPCGDCRMCLVEVAGRTHPVAACVTALADGMQIETHTPALESARRGLLQMWAQRYPVSAVTQFPDQPFHRYLRDYGVIRDCLGTAQPELVDDSHPYIHVDMARCIDCYRCVRICREVQGQFVWHVLKRGAETRIAPDSPASLLESSCVSCGACVDTCPTGALEDQTIFKLTDLALSAPITWTKTTCPYCGTGCEMEVGTRDEQIVTIRPVLDAPVNKGHLCVKGRYGFDFINAADRVTEPLLREHGVWRSVSWEEALTYTAHRLREILAAHGPDSIGVLGSARATNEENYLTQKFARLVLGTNNVDCCARVCHGPTATAMKLTLGTGAATNSYDDLERAQTILVCGTNTTENHPIIGARIKQAVLKGAKLIVIDPRRIELAEYADVHLQLRPGTNVPLLNALACAIVDEALYDLEFLKTRVDDWAAFQEFIQTYTPESVAELCGVEAGQIRQAARLYATGGPALCVHGLGMTEHTQGTEGVMAIVNLALLTGNVGKPGTGVNPLRGQNNVQGSAHMGCEPRHLTGYVGVEAGRALFEQVWQAPVPAQPGLNMMELLDGAAAGRVKALWAIGYDILLTNPNAQATREALQALDLVIIQDLFLNETAREFGTVFFPAVSSFEKDGTFMNAERRIQRVRQALPARGQAKADWEIICMLARALGHGAQFAFESAEEIWDEVRSVWPAGRGISYARIEQAGLQWPCPDEMHPGTTILHGASFPVGARAALRQLPFHATPERVSAEFPFLLITGRTLHQFNAGTMTRRTKNNLLHATDYLDIAPVDAARLQLRDGTPVRLRSQYGEAVLPIRLSESVKPGELFATFHTAEVFLNEVTSALRDGLSGAPEYKVTAVQVEPV